MHIADREIGPGQPCYVIAEIGINHNGNVDIARKLITEAKKAGCDAVKFQKRTVSLCYTQAELDATRESPWGHTNRQQKEGLEFGFAEYQAIDKHCRALQIPWFTSCWDVPSVDFIEQFNPPCHKIASASLTDRELLERVCRTGKPVLLSTGMSTIDEIDAAVELIQRHGSPLVLMHCTSTYPAKPEELNLRCIQTLRDRYGLPVGYSGHEVGLWTTLAAVMLGACIVERHITLDRSMYGSDQAASVEPHGLTELVRDIRACEIALGDGVKRVYDSEVPIKAKLRKRETLIHG